MSSSLMEILTLLLELNLAILSASKSLWFGIWGAQQLGFEVSTFVQETKWSVRA